MKDKRHKRKESYSILVVSNLDRSSRQFHIAHSALYALLVFALCICTAIGWLIYEYTVNGSQTASLREKLSAQEQLIQQQNDEKSQLDSEKQNLETKLASLEQEMAALQEQEQTAEEPEETVVSAAVPRRYPSSGAGVMTAPFSEDHTYISITTDQKTNVIAAGDGIVTSISSDDTYPYIIEIEHENGYKTRYLYGHDAELKVAQGALVYSGDPLLGITAENTELDYQILYEGEPIDPFLVIEAKG